MTAYTCRTGTGEWEPVEAPCAAVAAERYAASVRDEYGPDERAAGLVVAVRAPSGWSGRFRVAEVVSCRVEAVGP